MHANARLTERVRQEMVVAIEAGLKPARAAQRFGVSLTTVHRWVNRAREGGDTWFKDRSSAPHTSPHRISEDVVAEILTLRRRWGLSPVKIGGVVGVAASTVWRVLKAHGLNRKPVTPQQYQRRYERPCCGDLIHVDTKRAGRIPDGGGRWVRGIAGYRTEARKRQHTGHVWFHAAIDDYSRLGYVEVLDTETAVDTSGFLTRAIAWFRSLGIEIRQVMTDNAFAYVTSHAFADALDGRDHLKIRPYRPQTNGKVERFFRTLKDEWLYTQPYHSETHRQNALNTYMHYYNYHRPHTAITNQPPITRATNLPEQHR